MHIHWKKLAENIQGEVETSYATRQNHSQDASMYSILPDAVVFPKCEDDINVILEFCRENNIPLTAWGAGTSRGGGPLNRGLIINFRRHFNQILDIGDESLVVQPGVTYHEVQKQVSVYNRSFPPDPSYHQITVGGMIANNAAGIHSVKYGATAKSLISARLYFSNGKVRGSTDRQLNQEFQNLLKPYQKIIAAEFPRVEKNTAGYECRTGNFNDLLCGSEGTLALVSEATIATVPLPSAVAVAVLYFADIIDALKTAIDLRDFDISACELVDYPMLKLHSQANAPDGGMPKPLATNTKSKPAKVIKDNDFLARFFELQAKALLIVEWEGDSPERAYSKAQRACSDLSGPIAMSICSDKLEIQKAWNLRRFTSPILNRLEDGKIAIKPLWHIEDICLPYANLISYVQEQQEIFRQHNLEVSFFGHAASANLHLDPLQLNPYQFRNKKEVMKAFDTIAVQSYDCVIRYGGTISGEHGDGLLRTKHLKRQYPESIAVFRAIKNYFDPLNLLNPGKIIEEKNSHSDTGRQPSFPEKGVQNDAFL